MDIDDPRGYCPICRQFNYHAPSCPAPRNAWGLPRPRRSRLRTVAIASAWITTLAVVVGVIIALI